MSDADIRTWHCQLCPDVITGRPYIALMEHLRIVHPSVDAATLWPDGGVIVDSDLELLDLCDAHNQRESETT